MKTETVFTIGHSNHSLGTFVDLLRAHGVSAVIDVRSQPYSKFNAEFNRETLSRALSNEGIHYIFLGRELGARAEDASFYVNGKVQYRRLTKTASFQAGIKQVHIEARKHRVAVMCAEREPLECHRAILVARELVEIGEEVAHIHADGRIESHEDAMKRLLRLLGRLEQENLFRSYDQILYEAYAEQESRIAYVDQRLASSAGS